MLNRSTVNKVILMGYINGEPRWHKSDDQLFLCFPLVTAERIKTNTDTTIHEEVHKVRVPAHLAGIDMLNKGVMIYLQGRLQTKMFLDENKVKHYRSEIIALSLEPIQMKVETITEQLTQ